MKLAWPKMNLICPNCAGNHVVAHVNLEREYHFECPECGEVQSGKNLKEILDKWEKKQKSEVVRNETGKSF